MVNLSCSMGSVVLRKKVHLEVILPSETLPESGKFPVIWLLHGLSDDDASWVTLTSISRYAREAGYAVVMPDCGRSFYADMASGPRYWSFVSDELPRVCRSLFPISDKREENFVAGLSMGGYGALKLAFNFPERYAGVAAFSAVADIRAWINEVITYDPGICHEMKMIFPEDADITASRSDIYELFAELIEKKADIPAIFHACGSEDFLIKYNREFRDIVQKIGFSKYTYVEEQGTHTWSFWDRNIIRAIDFFKNL